MRRKIIERVAPRWTWRHRIKTWKIQTGEPEQELLPWLCDRGRISVDIGAAAGCYVAHMLLYSKRVVAFEPRKDAARTLRETYGGTPLVVVEEVALSDRAQVTEIRVPLARPMLGTVDPRNPLDSGTESAVYPVECKRLDDFALSPVGFIKIDVEGHERAVLEGARATITRERPHVLVEAEERHAPSAFRAVKDFLCSLDYAGFFLLEDHLVPISEFDPAKHQRLDHLTDGRRVALYVNNFLFVPDGRPIPAAYRPHDR